MVFLRKNKSLYVGVQGAGASNRMLLFVLGGSLLFLAPAVLAEEPDLFNLEKGWSSLEEHAASSAEKTPSDRNEPPATSQQEVSHFRQNEQAKAPPERALDLPALPGMRPVEDVQALSSDQENKAFLSDESRWQQIEEFDEQGDALAAQKNLKVPVIRYATLPNPDVKAIPDERISGAAVDRQKAFRAEKERKVKKEEVKKAEQVASPEACKALDELRRRQLEAIESDRRTLSALKKALSDLGLADRLSFMSKGQSVPAMEGELTASAPEDSVGETQPKNP